LDIIDEVGSNTNVVQVEGAAGSHPSGCANSHTCWPSQYTNETPEGCSEQSADRPDIIALFHRRGAICILREHCIGVDTDAAFAIELLKSFFPFIGFVFVVKNHH